MKAQYNPQQINKWFLFLIVFTSGMATLAIEFSASRLLGNVFGTSNLVWANVIGLILLYLTFGYFIGGYWADRSPYAKTLFQIIIWASFLSALIPLVSRPILSAAAIAFTGAEAAVALGSFISVLILFSVPITLLGMVSPFSIRLAVSRIENSGQIAGQIYAISTLGSLVGTFSAVLIVIPTLGTTLSFIIFSGIAFVIAFIGLWSRDRKRALLYIWMPVLILILYLASLGSVLRPAPEGSTLLYDHDSAYNYIQVVEDANSYRYLYLNEGQGIHSQWHPDIYYYKRTWDYFLTAPYFNNPPFTPEEVDSLLVIGLATGTIPRQYFHVYDDIKVDGIEIDPEIIEVGKEYFGMNEAEMPQLTTYAGDGRFILNQLEQHYRVIGIDAYRPPYIPWHLTTVEFFQEVSEHLEENGVLVVNVGRTRTDRRLVDAISNTLLQVYPSVHAMDVPFSFNTILVATKEITLSENIIKNREILPEDSPIMLKEVLDLGISSLVPVETIDTVFTDDRAPVETLVDAIVLNFILNGQIEELK